MSEHKIVHVEFSADDRQKTGEFYNKLFGWKIDHMDEMNYTMFDDSGVGGAFNPTSDENPAGTVLVYVGTDDVDVSLEKAQSLGAEIVMPKMEIPGFGWFGVFKDPTGNSVGLYKSGE